MQGGSRGLLSLNKVDFWLYALKLLTLKWPIFTCPFFVLKTAGSLIMFLHCVCVNISDAGARAACGAGEGGHGSTCDASLQWRQIWGRDDLLHPRLCQRAGRNFPMSICVLYMCQTCIVFNCDKKGAFSPLVASPFPLLFPSLPLNSLLWDGSGGCHCYSGKKALHCLKVFKRNQRLIGAKGMQECNGWKWWRLRGGGGAVAK